MKSFRIGLIGAGIIAREHAVSLVRNKRVASLGVYDADAKRAAQFSLDFRAMTARSTDELIERSDIVWVCSPPSFHVDAIRRACVAGKAIFCEKPLALTLTEARAIREAVKKAKVPFFMGHSNRFSSAFVRMKEIADRGDLGDLTAIWSHRTGYLDRKVHPAWRFEDKLSGGVIVELGVHEIDFTRWVGGDWKQVYATGSNATLNPGKFQDLVNATGPFRRSGAATIHVSWAQPRYLWQRGIDGTRGSLFWDDSDYNHVHLLRPGRKAKLFPLGLTFWKDKETGENFSLRDQAHAVLGALEAGKPAPVTLEDGLEAIKLALAMKDSIRTDKVVPIKAG